LLGGCRRVMRDARSAVASAAPDSDCHVRDPPIGTALMSQGRLQHLLNLRDSIQESLLGVSGNVPPMPSE